MDDGHFGAAYVLTAFNYAKAENEGVELSMKYKKEGFSLYGNLAWAQQVGKNIVSNEYLFDAGKLNYIGTHYIFTDHVQLLTASAGGAYTWDGTTASVNMIYGYGLRNDFANTGHLPDYAQVNLGLSHDFKLPDWKPFTLRFDVVNLSDEIYEIRDGTGIGTFAPQYGPRRGYFAGFSQKF